MVKEPVRSMKALEQRRPAVWVVPTRDVGIPAGGALEPVAAPSAEFLALAGSGSIASLAKILRSLALPPRHAQQYGHHLALHTVEFASNSALRWPP